MITNEERLNLESRIAEQRAIVDAAKNLIVQKGRHNTEIAYNRLKEQLTEIK